MTRRAASAITIRITSYNVCYTKLLRVFPSEVFFETGKAELLPDGRAELDKLASALLELEKQIPPEIAWVLRVDGHTVV